LERIRSTKEILQNRIRVGGKWYDFSGDYVEEATEDLPEPQEIDGHQSILQKMSIVNPSFAPKGNLKNLGEQADHYYDYLWTMGIINFCEDRHNSKSISYDELACKMIALAWEIFNENQSLKEKDPILSDCINFLIDESTDNMDMQLDWTSTKEQIYSVIKDFPMSGAFEDAVDALLESSPVAVLKHWIKTDDYQELVINSADFFNSALYSLHPRKIDPYIEINPKWKNYLYDENVNLLMYFRAKFVNCLMNV